MNHETIGQILGFILAHSAAIQDTFSQNELLTPYAITIKADQREMINFEADTQEQAVSIADKKLHTLNLSVDAWSYSQDGLITLSDGTKQDVLFFKIWTKGMLEPLQAYQMYKKHPFQLLGNIQILNYSESGLLPEEQEKFLSGLDDGIDSHPTGGKKWASWL